MVNILKWTFMVIIFLGAVAAVSAGDEPGTFSSYVDAKGNISLPKDIRTNWVHLGSWVVANEREPGYGFHDVYTQPESAAYYIKNRKFPDGTMLVKEIRKVEWDELPTGHLLYAGDKSIWFVMVKNAKGRFKDNPNWGNGWGWALFKAEDPSKNSSKDFKEDCLGCHEPAQDTDWVYVKGYPTIR